MGLTLQSQQMTQNHIVKTKIENDLNALNVIEKKKRIIPNGDNATHWSETNI